MRDTYSGLKLVPTLIGTLSSGSGTALGAPVDTLGFADVLAMVILGAVAGTDANTADIVVKVQESASITGTGALWTDITDGAINGSYKFDSVQVTATSPIMYMAKKYERLQIGRSRYIRAHATISGTDACNPKICVSFLLGRPADSLYGAQGATQSTGNSQFAVLK